MFELKLRDTMDEFERYLRVGQGLADRTVRHHTTMTEAFLEWVEDLDPDPEDALKYKETMMEQDYSHSHINNTMEGLEYFFDFQDKEFDNERLPRKETVPDIVTDREIEEIKQVCETYRDRAIIETLASSGLRATELCELTIGDLDLETRRLRVSKGKDRKDGIAMISEDAAEVIEQYLDTRRYTGDDAPLFDSQRGDFLTRSGLYQIVRRLSDKANLESTVTPHMFRHYFATKMIEQGADLSVVKELMRHSDIRSTLKYLHLGNEMLSQEYNEYIEDF